MGPPLAWEDPEQLKRCIDKTNECTFRVTYYVPTQGRCKSKDSRLPEKKLFAAVLSTYKYWAICVNFVDIDRMITCAFLVIGRIEATRGCVNANNKVGAIKI